MRIERMLSADDGEEVILYIEGPMESNHESECYCIIGLEGSNISELTRIYGIDKLQAIMLSIRHLKHFLDRALSNIDSKKIRWDLGSEEGDFGLDMMDET